MSITREKLNELVVSAAFSTVPYGWMEDQYDNKRLQDFAHALLKAVEAGCEVVAYQSTRNGFICKENKNPEYNTSLIALPLVKDEW